MLGASSNTSQKLEHRLQGRTLQVYMYLLKKKGTSGIREVQRDLGLSSPSVAEYQIEKLVDLGLVSRDNYGRCLVTRRVKVKALQSYVSFGRFTIPRLAFYASIFSAISVLYVLFNQNNWTIYGLSVPIAASGILWFETWKMWKHELLQRDSRKESERNVVNDKSLQVIIISGVVALLVFVGGYVFLFQYVEPNMAVIAEAAPVDVNRHSAVPNDLFHSGITLDESIELSRLKVNNLPLSNPPFIENFSSLATTLLTFAGALPVGFTIYIIFRYRCDRPRKFMSGVLMSEQHARSEF